MPDNVWEITSSMYRARRGIHQPHIGEISGVQYGRMSGAARRRYDTKRHEEWETSAQGARAWEQEVIDAFNRGEFDLDDPEVDREARSVILSAQIRQKESEAARGLAELKEINIPDMSEISKGDRIFTIMGGHYGTVTRVSKKSLRMLLDWRGGGRDSKQYPGALYWLSHDDLEAAFESSDERTPYEIAQAMGEETKNPMDSYTREGGEDEEMWLTAVIAAGDRLDVPNMEKLVNQEWIAAGFAYDDGYAPQEFAEKLIEKLEE